MGSHYAVQAGLELLGGHQLSFSLSQCQNREIRLPQEGRTMKLLIKRWGQ